MGYLQLAYAAGTIDTKVLCTKHGPKLWGRMISFFFLSPPKSASCSCQCFGPPLFEPHTHTAWKPDSDT